ncbi:MAG: hypothetical protein AVDCRST_MAG05-3750 [uncultured Rubrobacteraceae bacterium]|uniref:Uncharacterized protein n=1 Tax=uncultured Rubrobacteraceae bacterium TaxID=349277 RepID=A0A6J4TI07_9ACTN|nr:MAG: hypothetical protein AVDCRST_MAG05-3750 [uncultured Rubrobacteraceae bacterium]
MNQLARHGEGIGGFVDEIGAFATDGGPRRGSGLLRRAEGRGHVGGGRGTHAEDAERTKETDGGRKWRR